MMWIVLGLVLFCCTHLTPAAAPKVKRLLIGKVGEKAYPGIFASLVVLGIVLIVVGWRSTLPGSLLYVLPAWIKHLGSLLILIGFILMAAANYPSRIKRLIRHPQLTGVLLWAVAHLLMNGDSRSVTLFATLAVWCIVEIVLINQRDKDWQKPEPAPIGKEVKGFVASLVLFAVLAYFHVYFTGMPAY